MSMRSRSAFALAAIAFSGAAAAVPVAERVYTFCEIEDNDLCVDAQPVDASIAVAATGAESGRDCFYITGKLQEDCVWAFQPKCAMRALAKPLQCYSTNLAPIAGRYYEPLRATSDAFGRILNLTPDSHDRTVRLAVGAFMDSLDGTVNGLNQNSPHGETGEITVKLVFDGQDSDGPFRGAYDASYTFTMTSGTDAARVSFSIPPGVASVDIYCCNDTGADPVRYDVDFYSITHLVPNRTYCLTVVGGLDESCEKTPLTLGWFDKQWLQLPGVATGMLPELCILSDGEGAVRFAVSGGAPGRADTNFDGLADETEADYRFFLFLLYALTNEYYEHHPGASTKDASIDLVHRYPRSTWDDDRFKAWFAGRLAPEIAYAHGVHGAYSVKIRLAEHVDPSERPDPSFIAGPERADLNFDEKVNSLDLALLLSLWGPVPTR